MINRRNPEYGIQKEFVQDVQLFYPDLLFTISPAGFIMSAGMAMKMKAMGYRSGTPDILFLEPRSPYHGLLLEFKAPGKTLQPKQIEFIKLAEARGYLCRMCTSAKEALLILEVYLL
jgi:hypothetical protein